MPWYLYLAFKQLFPSTKRVSFFSLLSILGVMLGVMVLIVVQSVMNGFNEEIRSKIIDTHGHIRIVAPDILYDTDAETIETLLRNQPEVIGYAPYAEGLVMLQYMNRPAFPFIKGIEVAQEEAVTPLSRFLIDGSMADLEGDSIWVSAHLARSLGLVTGSTVELYTPLLMERAKEEELLLPREVTVVGIFETGWNQVDTNTIIVPLTLMQDLYGLDEGIHGFSVRLRSDEDSLMVAHRLSVLLKGSARALSWEEMDRDLLFVLRLEKTMLFFIVLFIIIVASFSITSSLMTSVVRKTREIGLLSALGAGPVSIASVFCLQGLIIGAIGTAIGTASSLIILHFRSPIIHWFSKVTHSQAALLRYYPLAEIPAYYTWRDLLLIITFTILITTFAAILPAWRAAKLQPATCLRSE
jgi:lipoprotein-releasing system permease protein